MMILVIELLFVKLAPFGYFPEVFCGYVVPIFFLILVAVIAEMLFPNIFVVGPEYVSYFTSTVFKWMQVLF